MIYNLVRESLDFIILVLFTGFNIVFSFNSQLKNTTNTKSCDCGVTFYIGGSVPCEN
jgi:hypothetical protein